MSTPAGRHRETQRISGTTWPLRLLPGPRNPTAPWSQTRSLPAMSPKKAKPTPPSSSPVSDAARDPGRAVQAMGTVPQFGRLLVEFELRDADEVSELLTHRFAAVRALCDGDRGEAGIIGSYASLRGIDFSCARFKGTFSVVPVQRYDGVGFFLPSSGDFHVDLGARQLTASPAKAIAMDAATYRSMTFTDGLIMPAVVIARSLIAERLSLLLGRPIVERPVFQPEVELGASAIRALSDLITLASGPDFASVLVPGALLAARLNEMILDMILEIWPSNYSSILRRSASNVSPRHVKIVQEYLAENPRSGPSGAELAALSGVSLRTLQKAFERFTGLTLADYARRARLEGAYKDLSGGSDRPIEDIALSWGFTNAGRFTKYFRNAYGVNPLSVTRRKRRP